MNPLQIYLHRPGLAIDTEFSGEEIPIFRYWLQATKHTASSKMKTVCAVMQNPSYACNENADRSVQTLERVIFERDIAEFTDVDRLIVVNQFAFIQTKDFAGTNDQIGEHNDAAIARAVRKSDIILLAWGKANKFKERQERILEIIFSHAGKTMLQTSRHPSRVVYDGFIQKYPA